MKRKICFLFAIIFLMNTMFSISVQANDASLLLNNTCGASASFNISDTGRAAVFTHFEGYPSITTGAVITIKIEKRNLLFFWNDYVDYTINVTGDSYFDEHYFNLADKGTYRCTVVFTVSGTGGEDDVLTYEDTDTY